MKLEFFHKLDASFPAVKRQDIYFIKGDGTVWRNFKSFAKWDGKEFKDFVEESPTIGCRIVFG